VGLDGVLGEEQLLADLGVAAAPAHPAEDLHLPLGERRQRRGSLGGPRCGRGAAPDRVRQGMHHGGRHLLPSRVLHKIPAGAAGDGPRDAFGILRHGDHDHQGLGVPGQQPPRRLHPADARHPHVHEHEIGPLDGEAGEDLLAAARRGDALHTGNGVDDASYGFARERRVVADENGGHGCTHVLRVEPRRRVYGA